MVDGVESEHDAEGTLGIPSAFLGFICGATSTRGVRCLSMIPIHRVKHFSHVHSSARLDFICYRTSVAELKENIIL